MKSSTALAVIVPARRSLGENWGRDRIHFMSFGKTMIKIIKEILYSLVKALRPAFGPRGVCIYPLTCTQFMRLALKQYFLPMALWLIFKRLLSCNPVMALYHKYR